MRSLSALFFLSAALILSVAAQSAASEAALATLPTCALNCLVTGIQHSTCDISNQTCVCTNEALQDNVASCVSQNCTVKQSLFTKNVTNSVCGVPIRNEGPRYDNITIIMGVISGFFVLLRLGFKMFAIKVDLGLDDWLILVTILSGVPSSILAVHGTVANGLGQDIWTLQYDMITNFGKSFYAMTILYFAQVTFLKMSLLFFYLQIFPGSLVRLLLRGTIAVNALFGVLFVFLAVFQCNPISFFWYKWDGEHSGTCLSMNGIAWANAIVSIILDCWMLGLPLWQLKSLQLNWKRKLGVGIMFSTGAFVTVVSVVRLRSLIAFADSQNPTWDNMDVSIWSTIEINIGIICACMPTLRLILVRLFPFLGGTRNTGKYYNASGSNIKSDLPSRIRAEERGSNMPAHFSPRDIVRHQTFSVEYGDSSDELQLVDVKAGAIKR